MVILVKEPWFVDVDEDVEVVWASHDQELADEELMQLQKEKI